MGGIAGSSTESQMVRLPPALTQPVAADDVAEALARISILPPVNDTIEFAGPQSYRLSDIVGRVLAVVHDERLVIADPEATYFGVHLEENTLIPGSSNPWLAPTSLDNWLAHNVPRV